MTKGFGDYQFPHPNDGKGLLRISERLKRERIADTARTYKGQHCRIDCGKPNCQCKFDREYEERMRAQGKSAS